MIYGMLHNIRQPYDICYLWDERDMERILSNPHFFDAIDVDSAENDAEDDEVTSTSAISSQETRSVRHRAGAHGW